MTLVKDTGLTRGGFKLFFLCRMIEVHIAMKWVPSVPSQVAIDPLFSPWNLHEALNTTFSKKTKKTITNQARKNLEKTGPGCTPFPPAPNSKLSFTFWPFWLHTWIVHRVTQCHNEGTLCSVAAASVDKLQSGQLWISLCPSCSMNPDARLCLFRWKSQHTLFPWLPASWICVVACCHGWS